MVRLKSYTCCKCARGIQDFEEELDKRRFGWISPCYSRTFCHSCREYGSRVNPPSTFRLNVIARAPEEELKLLEFSKWCPFRCHVCQTSIVEGSQLRVYEKDGFWSIHCPNCDLISRIHNEKLEKFFQKILLELKPFFRNNIIRPSKPTPLTLKSLANCSHCANTLSDEIRFPIFGKTCLDEVRFPIDEDGEIICEECRKNGKAFCVIDSFSPSFHHFLAFLNYVAQPSDLKLLTYSKWIELRCSSCSVQLSVEEDRLPMFHAKMGCEKLVCKKCSFGHEETCGYTENTWSAALKRMLIGRASKMILLKFLVRAILELRGQFKNRGIDSGPSTSSAEYELGHNGQEFVSSVSASTNSILGSGGQGYVRKEAMAVKVCFCGKDEIKRRNAFREVEVLRKLDHPNIVKYYDSIWEEERRMMTVKMEICGENLRQYIGIQIPHKIQVSWCHDIFNALRYLKTKDILHRDIKPENILIVPPGPQRGSLKLCDFGLSKVWSTGNQTQNQWNTSGYVALEVELDPSKFCFQSDLYSAGITLWELVNQKHASDFVHETKTDDPPLLQLIYKCTAVFLSSRISVEDAYAEIDTIKGRDIGDTVVNFDELLNVASESDALEDGPLQLSMLSS